MPGSFVIDCFPESAIFYRNRYAIVAIDVIRATTTAITALDLGCQVFVAATLEDARRMAEEKPAALLVGEQAGVLPKGFDLNNSPSQLANHGLVGQSIILVSTSGTRLLNYALGLTPVFVGCFRNLSAVAAHLVACHQKIALIGAGSKSEFRREDQMGCAYIGQKLVAAGYEPENGYTTSIVETWSGVDHRQATHGRSAEYLRRSGQQDDLEFVIEHFDDLSLVAVMKKQELVKATTIATPLGLKEELLLQKGYAFS